MIDHLNIGIRFALYANLMLLFGLPLFAIYALKGAEQFDSKVLPLRTLTCWLSVSGFTLSMLSIAAMTASMMAVPLFDVDIASIGIMIFETPMGIAWLVRVFALVSTLIVVFWIGGTQSLRTFLVVTLASGVALSSLAWTGHGSASEGFAGTAHLIADIIHLLGTGAWLGALTALAIMLFRRAEALSEDYLRLLLRLLKGFSLAGTIIVTLVVSSGLVNSWMLIGPQNLWSLPTTLYGQMLIAKLLLLGLILVLAAINRFKLTPAFDRALQTSGPSAVLCKLRKSVALELGIMLFILGLVAWLGTLEPPQAI